MTKRTLRRVVGTTIAVLAFTLAPAATSQGTPKAKPPVVLNPDLLKGITPALILKTERMTDFDPATDGFKFINTFKTVTGVFDIATGGLCAGMVYAAIDYWKANRQVPQQTYTPVNGTTLQSYLYSRNMAALGDHMDKWVELHLNPGGARDSEFFKWGLQGAGGGRLQELRAHIDKGDPVPLGLKSLTGDPGADHVVLAYGYDMGRYKGDLGQYQEDLKIFVYEPNYGAQKVTMVPRPERNVWCNLEKNWRGEEVCWRTYFVQQNYHRLSAPTVPASPLELLLSLKTGGDDLRGGNDNVHVSVLLNNGVKVEAQNVNLKQRWIDHTWQDVGVSLPAGTRPADIRTVTLQTTFGGGMGGDNWNLDTAHLKFTQNGVVTAKCDQTGSPLKRFTGDSQVWSTRFPC